MPFFLYIYIRGLRKGPEKFFMGSWKSPGFFLSVKDWEPCVCLSVCLSVCLTVCVYVGVDHNSNSCGWMDGFVSNVLGW